MHDASTHGQQQEGLNSLAAELVRTGGEGWQQLRYRVKAIGRYREVRFTATTPDGSQQHLRSSFETSRTVRSLRKVMAAPGTGAWFTMVVRVDSSMHVEADFDYDNEPEWQTEPGSVEYLTEQESHPRWPENQPEWFRDRLAAARQAERLEKGVDANGRME